MKTIADLKNEWSSVHAQAKALQEQADRESRELTPEEQTQITDLLNRFDKLGADIAQRERMDAQAAALEAPRRKITPEPPAASVTPAPAQGQPSVTGGNLVVAGFGNAGFRNLGEFSLAVRQARNAEDPRLRAIRMAASTYGSEGVGADGGYAVPPDFRTMILKKVQGEESLLSYTDQMTTTSNEIVLPVDETTPWQSSGGVTTAWLGEGATLTGTKPALGAMNVRTNKLAALVPLTDELLADAASMDAYLANKVPDKITSALNAAIFSGTGVGQPAGILGAASAVTVAAEGGQTAATVNFANITKMWSRMYAPLRAKGVWIINQDVEPQLFSLIVTGGSPALPAYLPPGGLSDKPYGQLFGRPVIYSEFAPAVGTVGDITFADLSQYITVVKAGGVRSDVSVHLYFDQDVTAFRFILRVGGQPWWKTSIVRAKSALPLSWAVNLAAR